jgi:nitroreductase/uncharacterized protein YndB with AHSA1/START domain
MNAGPSMKRTCVPPCHSPWSIVTREFWPKSVSDARIGAMEPSLDPFDAVAAVDHVLRTTRAVRRRLDLDRPVADQIIFDCIDLAEQSPTGGNQSTRRWLVIRDPAQKTALAALYREAGGEWIIAQHEAIKGTGHRSEKVTASAAHLAENLERVPAIVLITIWGEHDNSGRPGLFDSVIQGAWSFCLALRARGLGTAWTTVHLNRADEVKDLLGIPDGVTQVVMLPVAHTLGTDFRPAPRISARAITYFDRWGDTRAANADGPLTYESGPGVTVEVEIDAAADEIWPLVSDPDLLSRWSDEFMGATWDDEPGLGATFTGRNHLDALGDWETTSHVVGYEPNRLFAWAVRDADVPSTQWRFELVPLAGATRLRFAMTFGPGPSGLTWAISNDPDNEAAIIGSRQDAHRVNMTRCVSGIRELVEEAT